MKKIIACLICAISSIGAMTACSPNTDNSYRTSGSFDFEEPSSAQSMITTSATTTTVITTTSATQPIEVEIIESFTTQPCKTQNAPLR